MSSQLQSVGDASQFCPKSPIGAPGGAGAAGGVTLSATNGAIALTNIGGLSASVSSGAGLQIVAGHYRDAAVLRAAALYTEIHPLEFPVLPETDQ